MVKRSNDIKKYADFTAKFNYRCESGEYKLLLYNILFEPIKAKIIIKPQVTIEIYKDVEENIVFRKLQKIENLDFNNLNALKEFAKEKLDEFVKETETLKDSF